MTLEELRKKALNLPAKPGVYVMKDKTGKVIYVGKAKVLKSRVSSYFHGEHDPKTAAMVSKVFDFDIIVANTELESLVLESSLIKHHRPQYNILLKDDKGYPFIRLDTAAEYPAFSIVSKRGQDGARYFGPYGGRNVTKSALEAVSKALKLPTCGKKFPRDIGKERPCLNYHMGECRGWCRKEAPAEEYREAVEAAAAVLEGRTAELKRRLKVEMEAAAEELKFELAAEKRDRLRAIERLDEKQFVLAGAMADTDVVGYYGGPAKSCLAVLHYIGGRLLDRDVEVFDTPIEEEGEAVSELLRQYYGRRGVYPEHIYLPRGVADASLLEELFSQSASRRVRVVSPQRGEKARLVETANLNAREEAERLTTREEKAKKTLEWLQKELRLERLPRRIEAYDVSNTQGADIVASMVVFADGRPSKRHYRKFKIKFQESQDDCRSMAEALSRRVARYLGGDEKFSPLPDLVLVDGGAGQASAACRAMAEAGAAVPVFGMVKDERHRTRALVTPEGEEIGISAQPAVFALIGTIQEEAHRFAVEYHRNLRSKGSYVSALDAVEGVGKKRRDELLRKFGSLRAVKSASVDELAAVVPKSVAERIFKHFHGQEAPGGADDEGAGR